jgi:hypothetical protein
MRSAIVAKLFGIAAQLIGVDHRRVILGAVVTIKPRENERDLVLARRLELFAGLGGKIDFVHLCRRAPCQDTCEDTYHDNCFNSCQGGCAKYRSRGSHRAPLKIIPQTSSWRL